MAKDMSEGLLDAKQLRRRRADLKRQYSDLFDRLEKLFFDHDPIGISYVQDEYDPEVERLLPRIAHVTGPEQLTDEIHSIFQEMFSPEIAGPRKKYESIARDVWSVIQSSSDKTPTSGRRSAAKR
jgi:hypothetical protein